MTTKIYIVSSIVFLCCISCNVCSSSDGQGEEAGKEWYCKQVRELLDHEPNLLSDTARYKLQEILKSLNSPQEQDIIPIFVMGCPRSGTTLIGNYIGSCEKIYNFVEFKGFQLAFEQEPCEEQSVKDAHRQHFFEYLLWSVDNFNSEYTERENCLASVDSNPFNLLYIKKLMEIKKDAIYIVCKRSFEGVIMSLERSYKNGYRWAGQNDEERILLYCKFYQSLESVNHNNNIIILDYDQLCKSPNETLNSFDYCFFNKLKALLKVEELEEGWKLDREVFCKSYATKGDDPKRVFEKNPNSDLFSLTPIDPYNGDEWNKRDKRFTNQNLDYIKEFFNGMTIQDYTQSLK